MEITLTNVISFFVLLGGLIGVYVKISVRLATYKTQIQTLQKQVENIEKTYVHERELNNIFASLEEIKEMLKEERKIWTDHILNHKIK